MRRFLTVASAATAAFLLWTGPAWACGGLVGRNGTVSLLRTATLAAYHDGLEHYVTAFSFAGSGGAFGSIVPLPGVPSSVERGGDWTLQRLVRETRPPRRADGILAAEAAPASAQVLLETRIDALDVTVLRGGGAAVGEWAREHGFRLTPDAPEVLDFYAERSPIFLAARFDADAARGRGLEIGDGTPVHVTIPTDNPWVPLRILGLGKAASEPVEADVYLLTGRKPALLPVPVGRGSGSRRPGLVLERSSAASSSLLADLRADKGMDWLPSSGMWLTYLRVDARAGDLRHDLAVDASGKATPSPRAAGLAPPPMPTLPRSSVRVAVLATAFAIAATAAALAVRVKRMSS